MVFSLFLYSFEFSSRCDMCNIQSTSKRKLERHRRLCHETSTNNVASSSYRCFQCRKTFNQFAKLLIHKYSHPVSGVKSGNVCNLCRTRFDDIKKHHQETHLSSSSSSQSHDKSYKTKVVSVKETLIWINSTNYVERYLLTGKLRITKSYSFLLSTQNDCTMHNAHAHRSFSFFFDSWS